MDADDLFTVTLKGGRPWGVRLQGGYEYAQRIRVAKVGSRCCCDYVTMIAPLSALELDLPSLRHVSHSHKNILLQKLSSISPSVFSVEGLRVVSIPLVSDSHYQRNK